MHFLYILKHTRVKEKSLSKSNLEMDIKPPSTLTLHNNISNVYLLHRISLVKCMSYIISTTGRVWGGRDVT